MELKLQGTRAWRDDYPAPLKNTNIKLRVEFRVRVGRDPCCISFPGEDLIPQNALISSIANGPNCLCGDGLGIYRSLEFYIKPQTRETENIKTKIAN